MQSIYTRYLGPTAHKGARIKAKASGGISLTVSWDYALDTDMNHMMAAKALVEKLNWGGEWIEGGSLDNRGNVYVCNAGDSFVAKFAKAA